MLVVEFYEIVFYQGIETLYEVSNFGDVRNRLTKESISQFLSKSGYLRVSLYINKKCKKFSVHRLVAEAFILNTFDKPQINYINGNKLDNCTENLEWVTAKENTKHALETGLAETKLSPEEVHEICKLLEKGELSIKEISERFNVSSADISNIKRGKIWTDISVNYSIEKNPRLTPVKVHAICRLLEAGCDVNDIAKQIGVSKRCIEHIKWGDRHVAISSQYNIRKRSMKKKHILTKKERKNLCEKYESGDYMKKDLARIFSISRKTVSKILKEEGY